MRTSRRFFLILGSMVLAFGLAAAWLSSAQAGVHPAPAAPDEPSVPPGRANHSLTNVSGSIYMFGGSNGVTTTTSSRADLWRYDPSTQTWSEVSSSGTAPQARSNHAATQMNGQLYVFGGQNNNGSQLDDVWRYDPVTGQWSEVSQETRPPGRSGHSFLSYNGKFVAYGGSVSGSSTVWTFDPVTGYWTTSMWNENPQGNRSGHTAGMIGNKMYVAGGNESSASDFLQSYDLEKVENAWETVTTTASSPRPALRRNHGGVFQENKIYVFGGTGVTTSSTMSDTWMFNTNSHEWTQLPDLPEPVTGLRAEEVTQTVSAASGVLGLLPAEPVILLTGGINDQGELNTVTYLFDGVTYEPLEPPTFYVRLPLVRRQ